MRNQIVSELRKLVTTRSAFWLLAALAIVTGLTSAASFAAEDMAKDLSNPLQEQPFMLFPLTLTTLFALILGIRSFTDEFRHGSIVPTLLASPDRTRVLAAKVAAVGAAAVVFAAVAMALAFGVGVAGLSIEGLPVAWSTGALVEITGRLLLASVLWSTIGVAVGLAVRHQTAAIIGVAVWDMVGETAVTALLPGLGRFLPGAAGNAVVGVEAADLLAPGLAMAVLAAWAMVAAVTSDRMMRARDVA